MVGLGHFERMFMVVYQLPREICWQILGLFETPTFDQVRVV